MDGQFWGVLRVEMGVKRAESGDPGEPRVGVRGGSELGVLKGSESWCDGFREGRRFGSQPQS